MGLEPTTTRLRALRSIRLSQAGCYIHVACIPRTCSGRRLALVLAQEMRCHYSRRPLLLGHKTCPCARCGAENAIGWNARSSARPRLRAPGVYGLTCAPRFSKFAVLRWMAPHDPASRQSYIFSINQSAPFVAQASVNKAEAYTCPVSQDSLAERSKALA